MFCCSLRNRLKLGRWQSIREIGPIEEDILGKSYARFLFQFWKAKLSWEIEFLGDMLIGTSERKLYEFTLWGFMDSVSVTLAT